MKPTTGGARHSRHIYESVLERIFNQKTTEAAEEFERKYGAIDIYR